MSDNFPELLFFLLLLLLLLLLVFQSRRPATCACNATLAKRHSTRKFYKPLPL